MKSKQFLSIVVIAIGMLLMVSCSGSESDGKDVALNVKSSNLIGTWINTRVDWNEDGELDYEIYNDANRYLVLNSDGTGYQSDYRLFEAEHKGIFEWKVSGSKLIIREYHVIGNNYYTDEDEYVVKKLTKSELVVSWGEYHDKNDCFIETHTFIRYTGTED